MKNVLTVNSLGMWAWAELSLSAWLAGRSRKQKVLLDQDWVTERLQVNGREYVYKQVRLLAPSLSLSPPCPVYVA